MEPTKKESEDIYDEITPFLQAEAVKMRRSGAGPAYIDEPGLYGQLYHYSLADTKRNLDWAVGYWKNQRNAIPTRKAHKCKACQFSIEGLCKSALAATRKH